MNRPRHLERIRDLVGTRYQFGSSDPVVGLDCVTCAALVYRIIGEELEDAASWDFPMPADYGPLGMPANVLLEWRRHWVDAAPGFGAGVLFGDGHVGVEIDRGLIVHCPESMGGVVINRSKLLRPQITGYFRLRAAVDRPLDRSSRLESETLTPPSRSPPAGLLPRRSRGGEHGELATVKAGKAAVPRETKGPESPPPPSPATRPQQSTSRPEGQHEPGTWLGQALGLEPEIAAPTGLKLGTPIPLTARAAATPILRGRPQSPPPASPATRSQQSTSGPRPHLEAGAAEGGGVRLVTVPSIFTSRGRTIRWVAHAPTVGELLDREVDPGRWRTIISGRPVEDDQVLEVGDELVAVGVPAGPLIPIIIFAIVNAVIGLAIGWLIGQLLGPPGQSQSGAGPQGSATYNWQGIRNTVTNGSAIPITYGEHRVGGQIIGLFRRNANASSTDVDLHMLICLGFGPVTKIGQYTTDQDGLVTPNLPTGTHINGVEANTFSNVTAYLRMGRKGQSPIAAEFDKVIQGYGVGLTLTQTFLEYEFHNVSEGFHCVFDFPAGLYDQSGGAFNPATVIVEIEADDDGGGFSPITGSPFTFTHALNTAFARTVFDETEFSGTTHKIRIRRTTAEETGDATISDKIKIGDVNEVVRDDIQTYDGFALAAYKIRATDQLKGGRPVVTHLVEGMQVPTWDGVDAKQPTFTYAYSQNPARVALDLLLNKTYGLGSFVAPRDIDVEAFKAWEEWSDEQLTYREEDLEPLFLTSSTQGIAAGSQDVIVTDATAAQFAALDYCKVQFERLNQITTKVDLGDGRTLFTLLLPTVQSYPSGWQFAKVKLGDEVTDTRHQFNGVFDGSISTWDAFMRICQVGRAFPVKLGNQFSVRLEKEGSPVQHLSEANMVEGSLELTYVGSAEEVDLQEIQYLDAAEDYDQGVQIAGGIPPSTKTREPQRRNLSLYGITSARQARREANYHLLAQKLVRRRIRFEMPLDGIAAEQGDLISVGATMPNWSNWTGRVTGTPQSFAISHELVLPVPKAGKFNVAMIRTADDRAPAIVNITTGDGTYLPGATITTNSSDTQQIVDQLCTIGSATIIDRVYRITKMTLKSDLTVALEAVQYAPEIYVLQGWQNCILPVSPGCIQADGCFYFVPWSCAPFCVAIHEACEAVPDCICCYAGDIDVVISGDAASCITVHEITIDGVIIEIEDGCAFGGLDFCIDVTVDGVWFVACGPRCTECGDPACKPAAGQECLDTCQECYTVCV